LQQVVETRFDLFAGEAHLGFGQTVDGRAGQELVEAQGKDRESDQNQQPDAQDQAVREARFSERNCLEHSVPSLCSINRASTFQFMPTRFSRGIRPARRGVKPASLDFREGR